MKNRINKLLKIGILILGISLILTNCQNDDQSILDESQLEQITPLVLNQRIAFDQTQHFNRLQSKINKIKSKASDFNSQNRTDNEDIEILTDEVLYITYASTHTYSFKVLREQPQAFIENIVLHYNIETDDYNEYLVQYHIPAEEFVNLHNGDLLQSSENVTIIDLENGFFDNHIQARGCDRVCETIFVDCSSGQHHSGNVGEWGGCTASESPSAYQSCSSFCDQDNAITPPDGPSAGGGGGGNTTVVSNPITNPPCDSASGTGMVSIGITDSKGGCLDEDDLQIINEFTGKALCVYNKLKSSSTGFKNSIKKFEPEFPVAHLKFDMGDIGASRGRTIAPNSNPTSPNSPNFVITVRLNNNNTNSGVDKRPNLLIAKTIAHEVIHAEMYRKLLSVLDSGGSFDGVTRQDVLDALSNGDFPGMYDYFRRHKNWQHQQMATHYRESLARILQEYNTGVAVPNNQQPSQFYMDLSWEGLRYPSIHTWSSLPQTEKDRIDDVISDYISDNLNQTCTE